MISGTQYRQKISLTSISTVASAVAATIGKASIHLVKQSFTVSMYLLPFEEAASGHTKSIDIRWNGNPACTEARVPICCGLALLDLAWHGLHLRMNSATIRFIPGK
jgi:hypothetical protein